jgi:hypothetical protein
LLLSRRLNNKSIHASEDPVATPGPFLFAPDGMHAFQKSKIESPGDKRLTKKERKKGCSKY